MLDELVGVGGEVVEAAVHVVERERALARESPLVANAVPLVRLFRVRKASPAVNAAVNTDPVDLL